jgi:hypothetical protein
MIAFLALKSGAFAHFFASKNGHGTPAIMLSRHTMEKSPDCFTRALRSERLML